MSYLEKKYRNRVLFGQGSNALIILIAVNLVLFVMLAFMKALWFVRYEDNNAALAHYYDDVLRWFVLPADVKEFANRPWTILTFMFAHDSLWRIIGNMLWLWTFGYILKDLTGSRKLFPVYIYGSLFGAIGFILAVNFLPSLSSSVSTAVTLEASAGVMAIAAAATTLAPGYRIFPMLNGGIPVWILTAIYFVIDFITIPANQPGASTSHLVGAITGFLFIYSFRRGFDWGGWMNNFYDWINDLFNPERPRKGKNMKQELFYKSSGKPYKKTPIVTEKRVNEILDKINQTGYHSLTEEEKDLLKKASKEDF